MTTRSLHYLVIARFLRLKVYLLKMIQRSNTADLAYDTDNGRLTQELTEKSPGFPVFVTGF